MSESGEDFPLNNVSATVLSVKECSCLVLGYLSVVIDTCPLCSRSHTTCWNFDHNMCLLEVDCLFKWRISPVGSKGYLLSIVLLNPKYLSCTGQILSLTMSHLCLSHSLDFGFRGQ